MTTQQLLLHGWLWRPGLFALSAVAVILLVVLNGRALRLRYLTAAVSVLLLALASPLQVLADGYLFSAHMLQHIILLLAVPALLLAALPRDFQPAGRMNPPPLLGWLAGAGAMWIWHAPVLCDAAVSSPTVAAGQTVSLIGLGTLFWWPLLAPRESARLSPPGAVGYLFSSCAACTVLGIILTLSPVTVCSIYTHPLDRLGLLGTVRQGWGITPVLDQQIGGLLMWVPMCLVYLAAIVAQIARWYAPHPKPESI